MSIQRVIIDAGQGPSAVLIDNLDVPKIVEVRQGPVGADGADGADGAPGPNVVTSSTTSDGTADLYLETVSFNTANGGPTQTGEISWDGTDGTLDAMLESSTKLAIGEDNLIRVRNTNAETINKGDALIYVGTHGASGRLLVEKWVGSNVTNLRTFLGFAACEMISNANGYAKWFGKLDGIDTDGGAENWQDDDIIYAVGGSSATITNVLPTEAEYVVAASIVNAGSGSSGILFVRPTFALNTDSAQFGTVELTGGTFTGAGDENVSSITLATTPSDLGDGKSIDWRWGSGGTLTAQIRTNATASNSDELELSSTISGSLTNCLTLGQTSGTVGHGLRTADVQATGSITSSSNLTASGTITGAELALTEKSADPSNPAEGQSVIWQSDGTGTGDEGDILIKITAGGTTKTATLVDFFDPAGLDPDAAAYIALIEGDGVSVSIDQKTALSDFYTTGKSEGWYSSLKRIYLPIWEAAAPNARCMVSGTSGTFVGAVTHPPGYIYNGGAAGAYFAMDADPVSIGLTASDFHFWNAAKTAPSSGNKLAFGVIQGSNFIIHGSYASPDAYRITPMASSREIYASVTLANRKGIFFSSRASGNDYTLQRTNAGASYIQDTTQAASGAVPNLPCFLMSLNNAGSPLTSNDSQFIGCGLGLALTKSEGEGFTAAFETLWETCTGLTLP